MENYVEECSTAVSKISPVAFGNQIGDRSKKSCPSEPIKSSKLMVTCEICGDKASGFHYGVHACEGCKGFYRRTTRMKIKYEECMIGCKVNIKTRNKCQYCRFKKCVNLGMSRDAIRFGRMSKTEKEKLTHLLEAREKKCEMLSNIQCCNDKVMELIDLVTTSFHKHVGTTRKKMCELWDERSQQGNSAPTLASLMDAVTLYSKVSKVIVQSDLAQDSSNFAEDSTPQDLLAKRCNDTSEDIKPCMSPPNKKCRKSLGSTKEIFKNYPDISDSFSQSDITSADIQEPLKKRGCSVGESLVHFIRDSQVEMVWERIFGISSKSDEFAKPDKPLYGTSIVGSKLLKFLYRRMQERVVTGIRELIHFAKCLPGFTSLPLSDQVVLLKYGGYEAIFIMLSAIIFDDGILFPRGNIFVKFGFFAQLGPAASIMQPKIEFAKKIAAFNLTDTELALFISIILLSDDRPHLVSGPQIETMQSDLITALQFLISSRKVKEKQLFAKLLHKIADLRQLVAEHVVKSHDVVKSEFLSDIFHPVVSEIMNDREFA